MLSGKDFDIYVDSCPMIVGAGITSAMGACFGRTLVLAAHVPAGIETASIVGMFSVVGILPGLGLGYAYTESHSE